MRGQLLDLIGQHIYYLGFYGLQALLAQALPCVLLVALTWRLILAIREADRRHIYLVSRKPTWRLTDGAEGIRGKPGGDSGGGGCLNSSSQSTVGTTVVPDYSSLPIAPPSSIMFIQQHPTTQIPSSNSISTTMITTANGFHHHSPSFNLHRHRTQIPLVKSLSSRPQININNNSPVRDVSATNGHSNSVSPKKVTAASFTPTPRAMTPTMKLSLCPTDTYSQTLLDTECGGGTGDTGGNTLKSSSTRSGSVAESKRVQNLRQSLIYTCVNFTFTITITRVASDTQCNTRMLIAIILLFLVTEIPAATIFLLHVCTVVFRLQAFNYALFNKLLIVRNVLIVICYPFRLAIYCGMSQQFRSVCRQMITQRTLCIDNAELRAKGGATALLQNKNSAPEGFHRKLTPAGDSCPAALDMPRGTPRTATHPLFSTTRLLFQSAGEDGVDSTHSQEQSYARFSSLRYLLRFNSMSASRRQRKRPHRLLMTTQKRSAEAKASTATTVNDEQLMNGVVNSNNSSGGAISREGSSAVLRPNDSAATLAATLAAAAAGKEIKTGKYEEEKQSEEKDEIKIILNNE